MYESKFSTSSCYLHVCLFDFWWYFLAFLLPVCCYLYNVHCLRYPSPCAAHSKMLKFKFAVLIVNANRRKIKMCALHIYTASSSLVCAREFFRWVSLCSRFARCIYRNKRWKFKQTLNAIFWLLFFCLFLRLSSVCSACARTIVSAFSYYPRCSCNNSMLISIQNQTNKSWKIYSVFLSWICSFAHICVSWVSVCMCVRYAGKFVSVSLFCGWFQ